MHVAQTAQDGHSEWCGSVLARDCSMHCDMPTDVSWAPAGQLLAWLPQRMSGLSKVTCPPRPADFWPRVLSASASTLGHVVALQIHRVDSELSRLHGETETEQLRRI